MSTLLAAYAIAALTASCLGLGLGILRSVRRREAAPETPGMSTHSYSHRAA
jgi:hypothetical protein